MMHFTFNGSATCEGLLGIIRITLKTKFNEKRIGHLPTEQECLSALCRASSASIDLTPYSEHSLISLF